MKLKKTVSLLCAFVLMAAMLCSVCPISVSAETFGDVNGVLFDVTASSMPDGLQKGVYDASFITTESAKFSWNEGANASTKLSTASGDLTAYSCVNLLLYNPVAGSQQMVLKFDTASTRGGSTYTLYYLTLDWEGWKVVSIPVSGFGGGVYPDKTQAKDFTMCIGSAYWGKKALSSSYLLIDKVWCGNTAPTEPTVTTEYENTAGYIPADLGGDAAFTFNFSEALMNRADFSDAVSLYRHNGTDFILCNDLPYTVFVSGSQLSVVFEENMPAGDYKFAIHANRVATENGYMFEGMECIISVEQPSMFFSVSEVLPTHKSTDVNAQNKGFVYKVTFSAEPDISNAADCVIFKKNDNIYSGYTVTKSGNEMYLTFSAPLEGDESYSLTLTTDMRDMGGHPLAAEEIFTFKTVPDPLVIGNGIIYDSTVARDVKELQKNNSSVTWDTERAYLGTQSAKLSYPAGKQVGFDISKKQGDASDFNYVNWLVYSPKESGITTHFVVDSATGYFRGVETVDWAGWKVLTYGWGNHYKANTPDNTAVTRFYINRGGWGTAVPEDDYLLIDRLWLSKSAPAGVELVESEFADESGFVSANLGGDNIYSFSFSNDMQDLGLNHAIQVAKITPAGSEPYDDWQAAVVNEKVNVVFDHELTEGETYQITIPENTLLAGDYSIYPDEIIRTFTVGTAYPYFNATGTSPADKAEVETVSSYSINFNNPISQSQYISGYVSLYRDGSKVYSGFTATVNDKRLQLDFGAALPSGNYTVVIAAGFKDVYGNVTTEPLQYTFSVKEKEPTKLKLISQSMENGYAAAAVIGQAISLEFNGKLDSTSGDILVTDENGNEVYEYSAAISGSAITIHIDMLKPQTSYTLQVSGLETVGGTELDEPVVLSFTTESAGVYFTAANLIGSTLMLDADNQTTKPQTLTFVGYVLDENNLLLNKVEKTVELSAGQYESVSLPLGDLGDAKDIKGYVMNRSSELVSSKYAQFDVNGACIWQVGQTDTKATAASGKANVAMYDDALVAAISLTKQKQAIVVKVTASNDTILSENIIMTDSDGIASYSLEMPDSAATGSGMVTVLPCGVIQSYGYISQTDRNLLLSSANAADVDALTLLLKQTKEELGLSAQNVTDEQLGDIAQVTIRKGGFTAYTEVCEYILSVRSKIGQINEAGWATLRELMFDFPEFFGTADDEDYAYFVALSEAEQAKVAVCLSKYFPQNTTEELIAAFKRAVSDYKASLSKGNSSTGSTGGGSGGGKASGSFKVSNELSNITTEPLKENKVFSDLPSGHWAEASVMILYDKGIISAADNQNFRPEENITREEFVKLLVCLCAQNEQMSDYRFTDATENAWYHEYLVKAYAAGITTGYPDGRFGIGESITREDMAVLCARAVEYVGMTLAKDKSVEFTDKAEIAEYAQNYISVLVELGIISGMDDGSFAPKATATRAQAAKMIAALMTVLQQEVRK